MKNINFKTPIFGEGRFAVANREFGKNSLNIGTVVNIPSGTFVVDECNGNLKKCTSNQPINGIKSIFRKIDPNPHVFYLINSGTVEFKHGSNIKVQNSKYKELSFVVFFIQYVCKFSVENPELFVNKILHSKTLVDYSETFVAEQIKSEINKYVSSKIAKNIDSFNIDKVDIRKIRIAEDINADLVECFNYYGINVQITDFSVSEDPEFESIRRTIESRQLID